MNSYQARKIAIVNFTGFRQNWGCQATSWGLVELLNRELETEFLPNLTFVPLILRHEIDRRIDAESRQDIHDAMMDVCRGGPSADRSLGYLERLTFERYGRYAGQIRSSDLVILQAEGTMGGTDFVCGARLLLLPFVAKHAWKKPVMAVNQTIFSCDETFTQVMAAAYNSFDLVSVRENISFDAAQKAGIRNVVHIPDAAFLTRPLAGTIDIPAGQHFAVTGTGWAGDETYQDIFMAADLLKRETGLVPMIMISTAADRKLLELGRQQWGEDGFATVPPGIPHAAAAQVLQQCRFLLGGRYHMAIMAVVAGTPVIQLPGNSYKNEGLSAMLGGLSPVRGFDDHDAIAGDAAGFLSNPERTASDLRAALEPITERLQQAGHYFAAVQKGQPVPVPELLGTVPGKPVAAAAHFATYCANTLMRAEGFQYNQIAGDGLGKEPPPHAIFAPLVTAYHAGDHAVRNSLLQMLRSFPGKIGASQPDFRNEIYRLPPEILAQAGAPRPANPQEPIAGLRDLHRLCGKHIGEMKARIVPGIAPSPPRAKVSDISSHIETLREEFSGKSELLFYHAALICLIRREIETSDAFARFKAIWDKEPDFLRQELDSRWLISACDTFADHAYNPTVRALAMTGSVLVNTVKLYETENWAAGRRGQDLNYRAVTSQARLYDGISAFQIGGGDLIANMQKRLSAMPDRKHAISAILSELFSRMHMHDTVFRRFRDVHYNPRSIWDTKL
ncbi:polysaccharide pyruvyl transferase family protein [Paracoccus onubensis]|uniref:Polysaccharide pyruvyl transferase family protein n=2 Tax=Paracoccus onubensis TaxID=1675788 RepID=A0A418T3P0_9RHOB|nr:polysaccharide pyruvyl transferase family protein [Paracoccus onubensis]